MRFSTPCIYYNSLGSLGTQSKQAITGRVFSGNLQELFVSVQRLQRVWSLSERAGEWQQARKRWFPTPMREAGFTFTAAVLNWFTYHPYVNTVYPPLKLWFNIYTFPPRGLCAEFTPASMLSHTFFSCKSQVACLGTHKSSSCEHRRAINWTRTHARKNKKKLTCIEKTLTVADLEAGKNKRKCFQQFLKPDTIITKLALVNC